MAHFIQIGGLRDKCYVQIPDGIWSARSELEQKQITEAVEKGFIADAPGGIGIKKSPRYHISIKSDYRLCTQLRAEFNSETFRSDVLTPFVSPYAGRTPATAGEQRRWFEEERTARSNYDRNVTNVVLKFLTFDREKTHANLSTP
ncbi:hypothetical protein H3H36_13335 [Duganella sp. FT3S]|uniref:Uncharacterized protein n=1 Tax=Rugamonas fusca TaxID=2758568 RepID=A0A7W2I7D6_9BURK|nr:hypothetical protein [Rugamonas fusca]MBA5606334.1 hypothetical protein [Rugamonas fusca]